MNFFKDSGLINLIENSIFWSAKRFKFTQSFNTNVQYNEKKNLDSIVKKNNPKSLSINADNLFFMFSSILNSHYIDNSILEYYNLKNKKSITKATVSIFGNFVNSTEDRYYNLPGANIVYTYYEDDCPLFLYY
jgi:hypothetical protein